jgi:hypothetical protein
LTFEDHILTYELTGLSYHLCRAVAGLFPELPADDVTAAKVASHGARKQSLAEVMKGEMLASIFPKESLDTLIKILFREQQTSHSLLEGEVKPEADLNE